MIDLEAAASAALDPWAIDASYVGANGSASIRGVLSSGHQRVEGQRGPAVNSRRVEFSVLSSDFDFEPRQGDTLTIENVLYEVASIRPDEEGTQHTLVLKRV